jgi:hypothetical protein
MSLIALTILHQTTNHASTKALEAWYYVSAISLAVSVGSWFLLCVFRQNVLALPESTLAKLYDTVWLWSQAVPRIWGLLVAFWLYREVESSRDGDDNAIETIEIKVAVLQARPMNESSSFRRHRLKDSVIVVQHGPVVLGQLDTSTVLEEYYNMPKRAPKKFCTTAFSHFIESSKGSSLQLHMKLCKDGNETTLGTEKVPIPCTLDLKMSSWFAVRDLETKRPVHAEVLVEIQSRSQPSQFLFRASTVLPTLSCFVFAGIFWK